MAGTDYPLRPFAFTATHQKKHLLSISVYADEMENARLIAEYVMPTLMAESGNTGPYTVLFSLNQTGPEQFHHSRQPENNHLNGGLTGYRVLSGYGTMVENSEGAFHHVALRSLKLEKFLEENDEV